MTYYVLVGNGQGGTYTAKVLGWPECVARGSTRQEALTRIRQVLTTRLAQIEIVPMEIDHPRVGHPWSSFAGMFKDNPLFDEVLAEIETYRRELDMDDSVT